MKLWEVLKLLSSNSNESMKFFRTVDEDEFIICFIRPCAGSVEFRIFDLSKSEFPSDNPILYPNSCWEEISKDEADAWLRGNYDLL